MQDLRRLGICDRSCELIKCINDIANALKQLNIVKECVVEKAKELAVEVAEKELLIGCKPSAVASACIYIAGIMCGQFIRQYQLERASKVTEQTISRLASSICKKLEVYLEVSV